MGFPFIGNVQSRHVSIEIEGALVTAGFRGRGLEPDCPCVWGDGKVLRLDAGHTAAFLFVCFLFF